jgi:hypothetical protein
MPKPESNVYVEPDFIFDKNGFDLFSIGISRDDGRHYSAWNQGLDPSRAKPKAEKGSLARLYPNEPRHPFWSKPREVIKSEVFDFIWGEAIAPTIWLRMDLYKEALPLFLGGFDNFIEIMPTESLRYKMQWGHWIDLGDPAPWHYRISPLLRSQWMREAHRNHLAITNTGSYAHA